MFATNFEIINKRRTNRVGPTDIKDFELGVNSEIDAPEILTNARISLYALDFENGRAVFVKTATPDELSQAPFYYQALAKDSQAGSAISHDAVSKRSAMAEIFDPVEMNRFLENHPYIKTADYEVANTLKFQQ